MPDKEEKKKEVDQLSLGEEKDVGAGEDIVFQIQVQQYRCWNLDANIIAVVIFLSSYT